MTYIKNKYQGTDIEGMLFFYINICFALNNMQMVEIHLYRPI